MATYLVPQENSIPILTATALTEAMTIPHTILLLSPTPMLNMDVICAKFRSKAQPALSTDLKSGDVVLLELPLSTSDHAIWTGLSLYKKAIQNKIGGNAVLSVLPISCFAWS
ncbi:MAG: hypothetical protein H6850_00515 [Alphaproteobacteria bacterium]|nr:MAG: hypothetical protein H6850_00515 [Alphaproteobacteria bacterium]